MTADRYIDPDYVDVAERIRLFYERFPDGRILSTEQGYIAVEGAQKEFVYVVAEAWRTPDDPRPAVGRAWEPIPGPTPFTKDSELMNAETAAWGRAIIAAGIPSKKVASQDEVRARAGGDAVPPGQPSPDSQRTKSQNDFMYALLDELDRLAPRPDGPWKAYAKAYTTENFGKPSSASLTVAEAGLLLTHLKECKEQAVKDLEEGAPFG